MRKFGTIIAAFLIIIILVVIEIIIIKGASNYEPQTEVIFARVRIPEKTLITAEMLETKKISSASVHQMSIYRMETAVGKKAKIDIEAGEMLLTTKLGYEGMEKIEVKDKSKRLFSVEFRGDQANGWWLMADQLVDIIYVPDEKARQNTTESVADSNGSNVGTGMFTEKNLVRKLEKIRVAALIDDNGKLLRNKDRTSLPKYISFEVTDEQADFLAYAKSNGRLEICIIPE